MMGKSYRFFPEPNPLRPGCLLLALALFTTPLAHPQQPAIRSRAGFTLPPPRTVATEPVTDSYKVGGGPDVTVTDPYRWLEDAKSPQTRAFIATENAYTQQYFDQLTILPEVRRSLEPLMRVDTRSAPIQRGIHLFFTAQGARENQPSIYMRDHLDGPDVRLLDGPARSGDGNTSLGLSGVTDDGSLLTYTVRVGGADETEQHFFDLATRRDVFEPLPSARYYGVAVSPDKQGVFYSRFTPHVGSRLYYHRFGTPVGPDSDQFLLGGSYKGEPLTEIDSLGVHLADHGRWLVVSISRGVPATREDILVRDLSVPGSDFQPLVWGIQSRFNLQIALGRFFVRTDYKAPSGRLLEAKPGQAPDQWKTVLPEGSDVLDSATVVGGKLFVQRTKDVQPQELIYTLDGKPLGRIDLPGPGSASNLLGRAEDTDGYYTFQSIITPPTIFHYDVKTGHSSIFFRENSPFHSEDYELKQVFYSSKDGTRVPMFIAGRRGLPRDGSAHLLMTGYGGFALSEESTWNPEYAWWLQQGGFFALPNLRGGNEYGENWHRAAMFEKKQNVFDDWFAAAEFLIHEKYTSPAHFAIRGRSNGGLLMGASMTQRPDLFAAIWCGYPLLDMLRYQRFLMGRTWTTEYGSAENPEQFRYIRAYSPYQNVHTGTSYPAILFFTGDGDTRVDPMNARKMTPLMQQASTSGRPILLHYSIKGGHSAGISLSQLIEDYADEMSFLWTETK